MFNKLGVGFNQGKYRYIPNYFTIEVNATYVNSSIPFIYFPLSYAPQSFWDYVRSDGGNIRVYDSTNNQMAMELIDIDTTSLGGALHIHSSSWLDTTANTTFKIACLDSSVLVDDSTSTYGSYNVYSNDNYILHYNLTGANALKNRVSNNYHLTSHNSPTTDQSSGVSGYKSHGYNGTSSYDSYDDSTSASPWTLTTWPNTIETVLKINNITTDGTPFSLSDTGTTPGVGSIAMLRLRGEASDQIQSAFIGATGSTSTVTSANDKFTANTWMYLGGSRDSNSGTSKLYINDESGLSNTTTISSSTLNNVSIGGPLRTSFTSGMNGNVATGLVSNIVRPEGYFYTRYYNLLRPDLFFTIL